ncbi:MAG: carbohydrate ABC transporter substrate-binding protein, partial [Actinomycetota bacterium]|nr:carbohydrate ABC transporter substrate-binding protein [Actinomycetota bacterium]
MRLRGILAALGLVIACVSVACAPDRGVSQRSATDLEVVSWWTSGSEQQALTVLFDAYRAAHSGATVTNTAVAGGGGGNAQVVLTQRLLSGNPPDVWQTFPGGALRAYVDQGQV